MKKRIEYIYPSPDRQSRVESHKIRRATNVPTVQWDLPLDRNYCGLRAITAITGKDIAEVRTVTETLGRERGGGTTQTVAVNTFKWFKLDPVDVSYKFRSERKGSFGIKLANALTFMNNGSYYVSTCDNTHGHNHAIAVLNGKVQDEAINQNHQVYSVLKIEKGESK